MESDASDKRILLDRAQAGDPEAFDGLCRLYAGSLVRQAMVLCGNPALAEDLAQDTLAEAWRCLRRFNRKCRFFTWLCAILLNRYRNTIRDKHSWLWRLVASDNPNESAHPMTQAVDDAAWPDQAAHLHEQAALVRKCIQALPPKHQQVIYLRYYVDDSLEGIAAALGCSVGTVKSRLFYALERLRGMRDLRTQRVNLEMKAISL